MLQKPVNQRDNGLIFAKMMSCLTFLPQSQSRCQASRKSQDSHPPVLDVAEDLDVAEGRLLQEAKGQREDPLEGALVKPEEPQEVDPPEPGCPKSLTPPKTRKPWKSRKRNWSWTRLSPNTDRSGRSSSTKRRGQLQLERYSNSTKRSEMATTGSPSPAQLWSIP